MKLIDALRPACFCRSVLLLVLACHAAPTFAQEPVNGALAGTTAAHNAVRQNLNNGAPPVQGAAAQPVACPAIPNLTWSNAVAATAQTWAENCVFAHEGGTGFGENIAAGTNMTGPQATILWANEVKDFPYDYATNQCPPGSPSFPNCGHYTAVAWASTTEVGCGFAQCGFGDFVVCRYNPPGNVNVNTRRPYCTATQTTDCEPGPGAACGGAGNRTLNVNTGGTGAGAVTSNPAGINCGADCTEDYADGTGVALTAAANAGSTFANWGGDCLFAGNNPICNLNMTANRNVTATFNTQAGGNQTLTVATNGTGGGAVTSIPAGINCGADCTEDYANGTGVALTAMAAAGSDFVTWGGACAGAGANPNCQVTMDAAKNVTATFNLQGGGCQDDAFEPEGSGGSDDTCFGHNLGAIPAGPETHLACDEDWVYFNATQGTTYRVETSNLIGGSDTIISLHEACGNELIVNDDIAPGNLASAFEWTTTANTFYDVRIRQFGDNYAAGKGYDITVTEVGGCPATLVLSNRIVNGVEVHVAQNRIDTGPAFVVGNTGNATLTTGTEVVFGNDSTLAGLVTVNLSPNACGGGPANVIPRFR